MKTMPHQEKTRVQLDLSPNELERMNKLMFMTASTTRKDLFNNALTLLQWAAQEVKSGKQIAAVDKDKKEYTIFSMPALDAAVQYGQNYRAAEPACVGYVAYA